MTKQVQIRRGSTSQHNSFTGASGEITVDTDLNTIRVHNNALAGGHRLAKYSDLTTANVTEVTNLYFTNSRSRLALTSGNTIGYDNTTGNITLTPSGVTAAVYGNATIIPVITVDTFGRITNVSNVSSGGGGGAGTITSVAGVSSGAISNTQLSAGVSSAGLSDIGNVTLSNTSIIMTGAAVSRVVNLGNTIALCNINVQAGSYFSANSNVNTTWQFTNASSAANVAQAFTLELYNGGSYTQTWPNAVRWPGNVAPALSPNLYDMLVFVTDSNGTSWRGSVQTGYTA